MAKPDFTGEWTLNVDASALSPAVAAAVESGFVHIEHREPSVSVHLSITMSGHPTEYRFERVADGPELTYEIDGHQCSANLKWDEDILVFDDKTWTPDGELTIRFRYELQDEGRRLRAFEELRAVAREQDNMWVFGRAT